MTKESLLDEVESLCGHVVNSVRQ